MDDVHIQLRVLQLLTLKKYCQSILFGKLSGPVVKGEQHSFFVAQLFFSFNQSINKPFKLLPDFGGRQVVYKVTAMKCVTH